MRSLSLSKALALGLLSCALAFVPLRASAQTLVGSGTLLDSSSPNGSWKLYTGSFTAGTTLKLTWRGLGHLSMALYDKATGLPVRDSLSRPVTATYTGITSAFLTSTLTLSVPVNVPAGVLAVKNVDRVSGGCFYNLYYTRALQTMVAPTMFVGAPVFTLDSVNRCVKGATSFSNVSPLPARGVVAGLYSVNPVTNVLTTLNASWLSQDVIPAGTVYPCKFIIPTGVSQLMIRVSNSSYGITYTQQFTFLVR